MYAVINQKTNKSYVYKYAIDVISLLGCGRSTILRNKSKDYWMYKEWIIYNPQEVILIGKSRGKSL